MLERLRQIERAKKIAKAQAAADRIRRQGARPADTRMPKRDVDRGGITGTWVFTFDGVTRR